MLFFFFLEGNGKTWWGVLYVRFFLGVQSSFDIQCSWKRRRWGERGEVGVKGEVEGELGLWGRVVVRVLLAYCFDYVYL